MRRIHCGRRGVGWRRIAPKYLFICSGRPPSPCSPPGAKGKGTMLTVAESSFEPSSCHLFGPRVCLLYFVLTASHGTKLCITLISDRDVCLCDALESMSTVCRRCAARVWSGELRAHAQFIGTGSRGQEPSSYAGLCLCHASRTYIGFTKKST